VAPATGDTTCYKAELPAHRETAHLKEELPLERDMQVESSAFTSYLARKLFKREGCGEDKALGPACHYRSYW
jgi:hypothetical protein